MARTNSIITGTGSYIPDQKISNDHFVDRKFYDSDKNHLEKSNDDIIQKFKEITGIEERRYVPDGQNTSDMAFKAAEIALEKTDRETLDYIIVAHNYGDVDSDTTIPDILPSLAARVKNKLGIKNPYTVAYDIPFGCPGWLHGIILSDYYIKSGDAKKVLVIGAETLSRVSDPHDMDSMIYADGAGATLVESTHEDSGILSHVTRSDTFENAYLLWNDKSYNPNHKDKALYLKMKGHEVYKYAVKKVPKVVKQSLDKAGLDLTDIKKVLIHQANQKMDDAILKRLFRLYQLKDIPEHIMPMTISKLGNTSVATIPTLFDLIQKNRMNNHQLHSGDIIVFASVGAGMNINSMVYRMP